FLDSRQIIDQALDLLGINIETTADDQVLVAPDDADIALRIHGSQIAGDEKTVGAEFGFRLVRHPPIALEHIGTAYLDRADLALRQRGAVLARNAQLHAGQRQADRAR